MPFLLSSILGDFADVFGERWRPLDHYASKSDFRKAAEVYPAYNYAETFARDAAVQMKAFEEALANAEKAHQRKDKSRSKRSPNSVVPAVSACLCQNGDSALCAALVKQIPTNENNKCICIFDKDSGDAFPCFKWNLWAQHPCKECDEQGYCDKSSDVNSASATCYCKKDENECVYYDGGQLLNVWEWSGAGEAVEWSEEDRVFREAQGYKNMEDEIAIVTKAKENLIYSMATLSEEERRALSHSKDEFILKCSFNGKACDIEKDFKVHLDPSFGNCYTFNWNHTRNLSSSRAGPMYGLRVMIYVNTSEYLRTTESSGIRMTVHEKNDFPFPDTFGYNAPTGFISSFGLRLKRMARLPAPYGNCIKGGVIANNIYKGYSYAVEQSSCTGTHEECRDKFRKHGAMLEIFYEQMNFENLVEGQAYMVLMRRMVFLENKKL